VHGCVCVCVAAAQKDIHAPLAGASFLRVTQWRQPRLISLLKRLPNRILELASCQVPIKLFDMFVFGALWIPLVSVSFWHVHAFAPITATNCRSNAIALSVKDEDDANTNDEALSVPRRKLLWQVPLGAVGFYAFGKLAFTALSLSDKIVYPIPHESRVSSTIATALVAAAATTRMQGTDQSTTLRVLEVGIGNDARLIRRGLYDAAIHQLASTTNIPIQLEIIGLDIKVPTSQPVIDDATSKLQKLRDAEGIPIDWKLVESSIERRNDQFFPDGYFDAIVCCLTLCSVQAPLAALTEIKRLLRPSGGTFAYIEHVAVKDDDDQHRFLALQQEWLDPLQQRLADNCHLHRTTVQSVEEVFQSCSYRYLAKESFYVDAMWPVSCQACGVIQLTA
jgi:ubiquinone/menaquinone biosynthesis C-methylase UbiE